MKSKQIYRINQNAIFNWAKERDTFCIEEACLQFSRQYDAMGHIVRRMHKAGLLHRVNVKRVGSPGGELCRWRAVKEATPPPSPKQKKVITKKAKLDKPNPDWPGRTMLEHCWAVRTSVEVFDRYS